MVTTQTPYKEPYYDLACGCEERGQTHKTNREQRGNFGHLEKLENRPNIGEFWTYDFFMMSVGGKRGYDRPPN